MLVLYHSPRYKYKLVRVTGNDMPSLPDIACVSRANANRHSRQRSLMHLTVRSVSLLFPWYCSKPIVMLLFDMSSKTIAVCDESNLQDGHMYVKKPGGSFCREIGRGKCRSVGGNLA